MEPFAQSNLCLYDGRVVISPAPPEDFVQHLSSQLKTTTLQEVISVAP
ncbi:MAG: hypothetical protein NTV12_11380 [Verrucomicrobia bacterium]|nr:hypothetical protein [Verrucomicrobiota bacterium]